jgi:hypothetical protein
MASKKMKYAVDKGSLSNDRTGCAGWGLTRTNPVAPGMAVQDCQYLSTARQVTVNTDRAYKKATDVEPWVTSNYLIYRLKKAKC